MIWFIVAWAINRAQFKIGMQYYGGPFSGIGAIDNVLDKTAMAPMAYRVLVPWIIGLVERVAPKMKRQRLIVYETLKIATVGASLWAIAEIFTPAHAGVVAALLPATFLYDYWDWAGELLGIALAFSGNAAWASAGAIVTAMSKKETAPLVPVTFFLMTGDWRLSLIVAGITAMALGAVRLIQGDRELYCNNRWDGTARRANWHDIMHIFDNRPVFLGEISMSILITVLTIIAVLSGRAGSTWPVPLALLAAGWFMARAAETRIFTSCVLWISFLFVGG